MRFLLGLGFLYGKVTGYIHRGATTPPKPFLFGFLFTVTYGIKNWVVGFLGKPGRISHNYFFLSKQKFIGLVKKTGKLLPNPHKFTN